MRGREGRAGGGLAQGGEGGADDLLLLLLRGGLDSHPLKGCLVQFEVREQLAVHAVRAFVGCAVGKAEEASWQKWIVKHCDVT